MNVTVVSAANGTTVQAVLMAFEELTIPIHERNYRDGRLEDSCRHSSQPVKRFLGRGIQQIEKFEGGQSRWIVQYFTRK
jgi:hypothetical protein